MDDFHQEPILQRHARPLRRSFLGPVVKMMVLLAAVCGLVVFVRSIKMDSASNEATLSISSPSEAGQAKGASSEISAHDSATTPSYNQVENGSAAAQVTKCVKNGRITYTNSVCPSGSRQESIAASVSSDSPPISTSFASKPVASNSIGTMQSNESANNRYGAASPDENISKKKECEELGKRVEALDAMARQNSKEWMRLGRKEARDRQYRLGC